MKKLLLVLLVCVLLLGCDSSNATNLYYTGVVEDVSYFQKDDYSTTIFIEFTDGRVVKCYSHWRRNLVIKKGSLQTITISSFSNDILSVYEPKAEKR